MSRLRIGIAHAAFLGGGAEAVTLWSIQALQERYDIVLFTLMQVDIAELNARYGTAIDHHRLQQVTLWTESRLNRWLYKHLSLFTLRQQLLARKIRQSGTKCSLVVSTYNELDMGRPGLQYIHSPFFGSYSSQARSALHYPDSRLRRWSKAVIGVLSGASDARIRRNTSLTNSHWTASLLQNACGVETSVLYPPVAMEQRSAVDLCDRKDDLLCVGRLARDKKIEVAIRIIDRVRAHGVDVRLKIVGQNHDAEYRKELEAMRCERTAWLTFEEDISRERLLQLLYEHRFGIQARDAEQFGIAVAEMAAAGCIPFVPAEGGQAEIVENNPVLTFHDVEDAAEKIANLCCNPTLQEVLSQRLMLSRHRFSPEVFMNGMRRAVDTLVAPEAQEALRLLN